MRWDEMNFLGFPPDRRIQTVSGQQVSMNKTSTTAGLHLTGPRSQEANELMVKGRTKGKPPGAYASGSSQRSAHFLNNFK
jgi:hypothetical protein